MIDEPVDVPAVVLAAQKCSVEVGFAMACENRTGALLRTLAASKPGGRILELGTGTGVGTAWLLAGMDPTARLTMTAYDGPPFDMAFVDCRPGKFVHRRLLMVHLAPGALYVGDDLLAQPTWPADHQPRVDAFLAEIVAEPDLVVTLMRWSSGLVVAAYRSVRNGVDEPAGTLAEQVVGHGLPDFGGIGGRSGPAGMHGGGPMAWSTPLPQNSSSATRLDSNCRSRYPMSTARRSTRSCWSESPSTRPVDWSSPGVPAVMLGTLRHRRSWTS